MTGIDLYGYIERRLPDFFPEEKYHVAIEMAAFDISTWVVKQKENEGKEAKMSEFEFSEAEEKKITYYSMIMCSIYSGINKYAPDLPHDEAVSLSVPIFHAVIKSDATESLNKIAAEAMEYLTRQEKAGEEARKAFGNITAKAALRFKQENIYLNAIRALLKELGLAIDPEPIYRALLYELNKPVEPEPVFQE